MTLNNSKLTDLLLPVVFVLLLVIVAISSLFVIRGLNSGFEEQAKTIKVANLCSVKTQKNFDSMLLSGVIRSSETTTTYQSALKDMQVNRGINGVVTSVLLTLEVSANEFTEFEFKKNDLQKLKYYLQAPSGAKEITAADFKAGDKVALKIRTSLNKSKESQIEEAVLLRLN